MSALAGISLNPVVDFEAMTEFPFMVNALWAGTIVAVMAGAIGWFMVLRRQTFAGHTLAVIAFPGAAAAALAGLPTAVGYFGACGLGALALAGVNRPGAAAPADESASIGTLQAFALGLGFLFVNLYSGQLASLESLLLGTFLGITTGQVETLAWVAAVALVLLVAIGRPLLFASLDGAVARAAGVPVAALGLGFLLLLGLAVAATAQITGALLVFALLVTPAATAQQLTARPGWGLALSVGIALLVTWVGLTIAFYSPYPVGFWVTSLSFGLYVVVRLCGAVAGAGRRGADVAPGGGAAVGAEAA
jgi:zinc/manganese transport system permease protein